MHTELILMMTSADLVSRPVTVPFVWTESKNRLIRPSADVNNRTATTSLVNQSLHTTKRGKKGDNQLTDTLIVIDRLYFNQYCRAVFLRVAYFVKVRTRSAAPGLTESDTPLWCDRARAGWR